MICVHLWLPNFLSVATAYVGYYMFVDLSQRAVLLRYIKAWELNQVNEET